MRKPPNLRRATRRGVAAVAGVVGLLIWLSVVGWAWTIAAVAVLAVWEANRRWRWVRWRPGPLFWRRLFAFGLCAASLDLGLTVIRLIRPRHAAAQTGQAAVVEHDPGVEAEDFARVYWREAARLPFTPAARGYSHDDPRYWRVTLDLGPGGCVQVGVGLNGGRFELAPGGAPVACPPLTVAQPATAVDVQPGDPLRSQVEDFAAHYLAGDDVSLRTAPGVTISRLDAPVKATVDDVQAVNRGDTTADLWVTGTYDGSGAPLGLRVAVTRRADRWEVTSVRGGIAVNFDAPSTDLTVPATTTSSTTSTTAATGGPATTTAFNAQPRTNGD